MATEQELKIILGQNIRTRRESRDWTQEKLAEKVDVSKNTISDIEEGKKFARAGTLVKLAESLETDVYELLKPDNVMPDNAADIAVKYGEQLKEAIDRIGNDFAKNPTNKNPGI